MVVDKDNLQKLIPLVIACNLYTNHFLLGIEFSGSKDPIELALGKPKGCKAQLNRISESALVEAVRDSKDETIKNFTKNKVSRLTFEFVNKGGNHVQSEIEMIDHSLVVRVDVVHKSWFGRLFDGMSAKRYTIQ